MATPTIDNDQWLEAIEHDPELTTGDLLAAYYYIGADTDLTDDQLQASFGRLYDRGYFAPVLVLDGQASFDVKRTIPQTAR
jgi:hypothetical protein